MKYNDNGVIKEISVKASDTLPIGTIVDYDGTVVPDGWKEVPDINNYSTEEQIVGTYFGKTLYQKGFIGTIPTEGTSLFLTDANSGMEEIVDYFGNVTESTGPNVLVINDAIRLVLLGWNNQLLVQINNENIKGQSYKIIVKYTKITD